MPDGRPDPVDGRTRRSMVRHGRVVAVIAAVFTALMASFVGPASGAVIKVRPSHVLRELADAVSNGDTGSISSLLADDVQWVGCGADFSVCNGKAQVMDKEIGYDLSTGAKVRVLRAHDVIDS